MLIIMINNDENNWSTNDYNGDQAITIFQAIHFREPLLVTSLGFWHLIMYSCMVIDVAKLEYYQSMMIL